MRCGTDMPTPATTPPLPSPAAAGTSPFLVKGVVYRTRYLEWERAKPGEQTLADVLAAIDDPAERTFFSQTFHSSAWYDLLPIDRLGRASCQVAGEDYFEALRWRARAQAEKDARGVYKAILSFTSPEMILKRVPWMMAQYYRFGATETRIVAPGYLEITRVFPAVLDAWASLVGVEFFQRLFSLCRGVRSPVTMCDEATPAEPLQGIAAIRLRYTVRF
jgi:hypothetical protein